MADTMLYRLTARCPRCHAPVRLRNAPLALDLLRIALHLGYDRDDVIQTYQCARKLPDESLCNTMLEIKLGDWVTTEVGR